MKRSKAKKTGKKRLFGRIAVSVVTVLLLVFIFLTGCVLIMDFGPSETATNLFVNSVMESSAGKFMATLFFTDEHIKEIRAKNSVVASGEVTDSDMIQIAADQDTEDEQSTDAIEVQDIEGATYKGKLMIIHDPSRVTVGVSGDYGSGNAGKSVSQMAESYQAVAATNGGGFEDANGTGNGGTPIGIVISDGVLKYGSAGESYEIIGFDRDNKLVVGKMTGQEALDRGVRDALSFGPILIVNGEPSAVNGEGSGLNPRTAIGQRADGAILLLVIDGRQVNSLGASYSDLVKIMLNNGAVNAANLDGGSSSLMYYNGEYINSCASLYGPRNMPTSIIVR